MVPQVMEDLGNWPTTGDRDLQKLLVIGWCSLLCSLQLASEFAMTMGNIEICMRSCCLGKSTCALLVVAAGFSVLLHMLHGCVPGAFGRREADGSGAGAVGDGV